MHRNSDKSTSVSISAPKPRFVSLLKQLESLNGSLAAATRPLWLLVILLFTSLSALLVQAENIILFIGDGMGFEQVKAARYYAGEPLSFELLPFTAECTTYSANNAITDSAAGSTAIATGVKVNNGVISLRTPGDGLELETLLEFYQKRGKKVGLITTTVLTHATPAAFAAHEPSRNNSTQIAGDYLYQTRPNILFGGGGSGLDPIATANAGYVVVTDTAGFNSLPLGADYLSAQFGTSHMPYEAQYLGRTYPYPRLTDMLIKALSALEFHPGGFFLMVEGGRIDHACHENKLVESVHETIELSHAVAAALIWAAGRSDTTILVTADHETGGLMVTGDNGPGQYPSVTWSTKDHTAANVPVYAVGRNAELVSGTLDNTDFFDLFTAENTASPILSRVSSTVTDGTSVRITWTTDVPANSTVDYRLSSESVWTSASVANLVRNHSILLTGLAPERLYHYRVTSAAGGVQATSAEYVFMTASQPITSMLIATGSIWNYDDTGTDLGTAWRQTAYNDSGWASGPAKLGYGQSGIATTLDYGGDSNNKYPCYYFRHSFTIDNPLLYENLSLSILRDDGAVVYLNGVEVARYNMPSGQISYSTWASTAASVFPWDPPRLIPNLLVSGKNVLAVEVHQVRATSSDVILDLELTAKRLQADSTPPTITGVAINEITARTAIITWTTDEPADSRVDYGLTQAYDFAAGSEALVTQHSVELTNLEASTTYHLVPSSKDAFGNISYGPAFTLTTLKANQPPVAVDDTASTKMNEPVQIDLLANDSDPDGDSLILILPAATSAGGSIATFAHGTVTYTPPHNWFGIDTFTYSISDGELIDMALVTVTVTDASPMLTVRVLSIAMSATRSGKNWKVTASVKVVDQANAPAARAVVYGDWLFDGAVIASGSSSRADSAGVAVFSSPTFKADRGTFTFRVTDVQFTNATYASDLNTITENSIQVPY
jgi:alkaline phosphatase